MPLASLWFFAPLQPARYLFPTPSENQSSDIPFATWTTWSFRRWKHLLWSSCWNPNFKHCPVTLASAKPSMNAVISWSWLSSRLPPWASYGKLWQAMASYGKVLAGGMMSFNLPNSIKQHPVCGSLVKRISYFCWSLFSSCQMDSNGAKLQIPIAQWTQKNCHSYYQTWPKHPFGKCIMGYNGHKMILNYTIPLNPISKCQQTGNQNNQWLDCIPPWPSSLLHLRSPGARVGRWWCWIFDWW